MMRARKMAVIGAGAAAIASLAACGGAEDEGPNVANYTEEAISGEAVNDVAENVGTAALPLDHATTSAGNSASDQSASGEEAAPVQRKKRRP
jgi:hypothetical protein